MIRKTFLSFIFSLWPSIFSAYSYAQEETLKIGFVNIRQILTQAPQLKTIETVLRKDFFQQNKEVKKVSDEITDLKLSLSQTQTDLQKNNIEAQLFSKQRQLNRLNRALQEEYGVRRNEALGKFQTFVVKVIAKVSKEKKLDMVLNNTGVIYVNNRVDITEDVLSELAKLNQ